MSLVDARIELKNQSYAWEERKACKTSDQSASIPGGRWRDEVSFPAFANVSEAMDMVQAGLST